MVLCNKDCVPCCDFCIYAVHERWTDSTGSYVGAPEGCTLHPDREHQDIAENFGSCDDFHCFMADKHK